MRRRIIENLTLPIGNSEVLAPVHREQFLVYVMGPYRTVAATSLRAETPEQDSVSPQFATWDDSSGEYSEDEVLRLLKETRDCLRERGFNAFLAIDVGISLDEMDAATQSIAFARASNVLIFVIPEVGANLGVGIEIGSVLEDVASTAGSSPPNRASRALIAREPAVDSAMLRAVHDRWDASLRTFTDAGGLCRLSAQFSTHIQAAEHAGLLDTLD